MYQNYRKLLQYYEQFDSDSSSISRSIIEKGIIILVLMGFIFKKWTFPTRAIGGWRWIWCYRWEVISGWYEYDTVQLCKRLINTGMTAIDIGAHIGYYSRLFSKLVGQTGCVFAYEPSPENFSILQSNLRFLGRQNTTIFPLAVCAQGGKVPLYISPGHSNHSLNPGFTEHESVIDVDATTLDAHLSTLNHPNIHFIKIDAEGSEIEILNGMTNTIKNNPSLAMIIELNPAGLRAAGHEPRNLLELLASLGYIAREISIDNQLLEPDLVETQRSCNLLCLTPEAWKSYSPI
jgi:FkbM family methyltransferase